MDNRFLRSWNSTPRVEEQRTLRVDETEAGRGGRGFCLEFFCSPSQGDFARARPLYERALAICEKALGPEHPDTAKSLSNLADLLYVQNDFPGAQPLYERTLAIRERALGPEHPDTVMSLNNLAALLRNQGDFAGARPLYERALAIREKALGPGHPETAASLNDLAVLLGDQGDFAGARLLLKRALAIAASQGEALTLGETALGAHDKTSGETTI